jgi:hypothetical protein
METQNQIKSFISKKNIAVVGVSSKGKGFGTAVYKHLKENNYNVFPVNINGGFYEQEKLFKDLYEINQPIEAVVTVVPPSETENVVRDAIKLGIKNIWMQQGSESKSAIEFCKQNNVNVVHGECILMFAEPVKSIHSFHRWLWKLIGKYPTT